MAISREAYEILEACVGSENITEDPAILESYSWYFLQELQRRGTGTRFLAKRPGVVILPANTIDVQAIIKTCNRFNLKSKAHSTAFGAYNAYSWDDVVMIDLRRMNRILEIDDKNRYAVVEPYVTWAQLHSEAMKLGLTPCIAGVGAQCSVLANLTCGFGMGPYGYSMGFNERNSLAVEWVLPEGDILRMGSLGASAGWFCGDGPGPNLRGLMRGEYGNMGGLGVVTTCAVKLYHWEGPAQMPVDGIYPKFRLSEELPPNMRLFLITYSDRGKRDEGLRRMAEAEIGYTMYCWGFGFLIQAVPELAHLIPTKPEAEMPSKDTTIAMTLVCNSSRDIEYQEKALKKILDETDGKISSLTDDPGIKCTLFRYLVRADYIFLTLFRHTGGWWISMFDYTGPIDTISKVQEKALPTLKKWEGKGVLLGCADAMCQPMYEGCHTGYTDHSGGYYDPTDPQSRDSFVNMVMDINRPLENSNLIHPTVASNKANQRAGALMSNFHIWQKKLKAAFDPRSVSDGAYYIEVE